MGSQETFDLQFSGLCVKQAGVYRFDVTLYCGETVRRRMPVFVRKEELKKTGWLLRRYLADAGIMSEQGVLHYSIDEDGTEYGITWKLVKQADASLHLMKFVTDREWEMDLSGEDILNLSAYLEEPY